MGPTLLEHQVMASQPTLPGTVPEGQNGPQLPATADILPCHVLAGLMVTGAGIVVGVAAAGLFVNQARQNNAKRAWTLFGLHLSAIVLIAGHRFLTEWVAYNRPPSQAMVGAIPGIIGSALYAYTVPNSLTAGETRLGLIPLGSLGRRAEMALVMGALGIGLFTVWAMLSAQQGIQPYVRESVLILATVLSTTGISLAFTNAQQYRALVARGFEHVQRARQQTNSQHSATLRHGNVRRPLALPLELPRLGRRPSMPPRGDSGLPMLPRRSSVSTVTATGVSSRQAPAPGEALAVRRASVPHTALAWGTSSNETSPSGAMQAAEAQPLDYFAGRVAHDKAC
jgi:hypothetical protein